MIRRSVDTKKTAPKLISERRSAESDSMGINCDMSEGRGGGYLGRQYQQAKAGIVIHGHQMHS